jgi:hypothetical protein
VIRRIQIGFARAVLKVDDCYLISAPTFETKSEKYSWLNDVQAIGKMAQAWKRKAPYLRLLRHQMLPISTPNASVRDRLLVQTIRLVPASDSCSRSFMVMASGPFTTDVSDKQFLCSAEASRFSVPAWHFGWRRAQGWSRLAGATAARGLVLTIPSTASRLAVDGPRSLLICGRAPMTAWQRAGPRGESAAAPPYCRSSFAAPVRAFGPLAFQPATKRA